MSWLLDNPVATMHGPFSLILYGIVIAVTLLVRRRHVRLLPSCRYVFRHGRADVCLVSRGNSSNAGHNVTCRSSRQWRRLGNV